MTTEEAIDIFNNTEFFGGATEIETEVGLVTVSMFPDNKPSDKRVVLSFYNGSFFKNKGDGELEFVYNVEIDSFGYIEDLQEDDKVIPLKLSKEQEKHLLNELEWVVEDMSRDKIEY